MNQPVPMQVRQSQAEVQTQLHAFVRGQPAADTEVLGESARDVPVRRINRAQVEIRLVARLSRGLRRFRSEIDLFAGFEGIRKFHHIIEATFQFVPPHLENVDQASIGS